MARRSRSPRKSAFTVSVSEGLRRRYEGWYVAVTHRPSISRHDPRTAFIADSDVSFGMARMYATLSADTDSGFMVYRAIEEGDAWLGWQRVQSEQRAR